MFITPAVHCNSSSDTTGIHDKNSKSFIEFSNAKLATFLSRQAAPTSKLPSLKILMFENSLPNLIMVPSNPPSLKSVFDPAPSIWIF